MKIKLKKVIDLQSLLMWVGFFCVVSFALLEHMSIPIPAFSAVKLPLMYVGAICVIPQITILFNNILKKRYFYIFLVLFALCVFLLFSMQENINTVRGFSPVRNTIRLILYLLELFILMMAIAEKGMSQAAIKMVYSYVLALVVLTDVFMFTGLLTFGTKSYPHYLVGTKFTVVYMHFNLVAFWSIRQWEKIGERTVNRWAVWCVAVVLLLLAIYVDCMTGVLGALLLAMILVRMGSSKKTVRFLTSPTILILCITACTLIAFVIGFFLNIPFITTFVEEVLGRSTTLTGRVNIYRSYGEAMQNHWLFGYGYGSGNQVAIRFFGCTNAQNAVLHWILQCGIIVSALLIALFALVMKQAYSSRKRIKGSTETLIALVYTYIILGIVEITYSMSFIMFMALIFMSVNDRNGMDARSQRPKIA